MKFSRLFRIGSQAYRAYRSYKGKGGSYSSGYGGSRYGSSKYGGYRRSSGGTVVRLLRKLLK